MSKSRVTVSAYQLQPHRFLLKLALLIALTACTAFGILNTEGLGRLTCQIGMALLLAHATELMHECLHGLATGKRRIDRAIGTMLGLPTAVSYRHYLYWHFHHHAHNGTDQDHESFGYAYELLSSRSLVRRVCGVALHLSMACHWYAAAKRVLLAVAGRLQARLTADPVAMPVKIAASIQTDYQRIAGFVAILTAATILTDLRIVELFFVPVSIWSPVHALIELPEHIYCDTRDPNVRHNTRSIDAGWFMRWLTNNNCNHVGHHMDMRIPMHRLPDFERRMMATRRFGHLERSYCTFYTRFVRCILRGELLSQPHDK